MNQVNPRGLWGLPLRADSWGQRALEKRNKGKSGRRWAPARSPDTCTQGSRATHRDGVRRKGGHTPAHLVLAASQGDQRNAAQPDLRRRPGHT